MTDDNKEPTLEHLTDIAWPPAPYDKAAEYFDLWQAWWSGNTDKLARIYAQNGQPRPDDKISIRFNKNIEETFFWGRSNEQGTRRRHIAAPASIATGSASLLFSKPPRISAGTEDAGNRALADRIDNIFGPDAYGGELAEAAELASVFGGVFLRPWWDTEVCDHVIPSHVSAQYAIPEFRLNRLVAVTFWGELCNKDGDVGVYRHLERHEKGKIIHSLWLGTESKLGTKVDLSERPETAWVKSVENTDDDDKNGCEGVIYTGLDRLDVVYVPNVRPSREWSDIAGLSSLGRSDFEGIESEFDALDEVYTSLLRDVEDAKSRIFIDEMLLEDLGVGRGGAFDRDKHVYVKTQTGMGSMANGDKLIQAEKFNIRFEEHAQTIAEIKSHILEHVGLANTHISDGNLAVGVSATEINSRNSVSEATRAKKINFWQPALREFVKIVMELDARHFGTGYHLADEPVIRFAPQKVMTDQELALTIQTKRSSGVMSREEGVRVANPDWGTDEVQAELERIHADALADAQLAFGRGLDGDMDTMEGMEGVVDPADQFVDAMGMNGEDDLQNQLPEYARSHEHEEPETVGDQMENWQE